MFKLYLLLPFLFFVVANTFGYSGGSGLSGDPYQISTLDDIYYLSQRSSDWDKHFILTADIDLYDFAFKPIASGSNRFTGSFDGRGYSIQNMYLSGQYSSAGFFAAIGDGAVVENLNITNGAMNLTNTGWLYAGFIAGLNAGSIVNCSVSGMMSAASATTYAGLIAGFNYSSGYIGDCYSAGAISASYCGAGISGFNQGAIHRCQTNSTIIVGSPAGALAAYAYAGGITGFSEQYSTITDSSSSGIIDLTIAEPTKLASGWAGGISGFAKKGSFIDSCYSSADITAEISGKPASAYSGGICGKASSDTTLSYSSGNIIASAVASGDSGAAYAGGVFGQTEGGSTADCYASGTALATASGSPSSAYSGGFAGMVSAGEVARCYSLGKPSGSQHVGAFLGRLSGGLVSASFFDVNTSQTQTAIGSKTGGVAEIYGKTTEEMKTRSTFTDFGWDFANIWRLAWFSYPMLTWQNESDIGDGSAANPYRISTAEQLMFVSSDLSANYILTQDIDLAGVDFEPIGIDWGSPFNGSFDGNGHIIKNLTIHDQAVEGCVGLFGVLGVGSVVKNLGVENASIDAPNAYFVGAITGWGYGQIQGCFTSGDINGNTHIGGIAGGISDEAYIADCYSKASITAIHSAGGIVGLGLGNAWVQNCYYSGQIYSDGSVGGIAALSDGLNSSGCVFDVDECGFWWTAAGEGKRAYLMYIEGTYTDMGWDFGNVWKFSGLAAPLLKWQTDRNIGTGSTGNPYQITNVWQLQAFTADYAKLASSAILKSDIDMTGLDYYTVTDNWSWPFIGSFDGNKRKISNLSVASDTGRSLLGLFGFIGAGGIVKDLQLDNIHLDSPAGYFIGGVAGWSDGTVSGVSSNGYIRGGTHAGGIIGGGSGVISDCYSTCRVIAEANSAGGLVGLIDGSAAHISTSYANSTVSSNGSYGAIAAIMGAGAVNSTYYNSSLTPYSAAGAPLTASQMYSQSSYSGFDFQNVWAMVGAEPPIFKWQSFQPDINGDGIIDFSDLLTLTNNWLSTQTTTADINTDGIVNLRDFAHIARGWIE